MQNNDFRAKQFLPFDALIGFRETLKLIENSKEDDKLTLSEDMEENINYILNAIEKGDNITVKYFNLLQYLETTGIVKKIENKKIYLLNTIINFEDIIDVKLN